MDLQSQIKKNKMKNKLRFIMPRLVGATVLAGITAVIITTVFKLLLGITLMAGIVAMIVRSIKGHERLAQYQQGALPNHSDSSFWEAPIQAVSDNTNSKRTTIVPLN